eukprot:16449933-Heterocapsa_arctica.AAC.1
MAQALGFKEPQPPQPGEANRWLRDNQHQLHRTPEQPEPVLPRLSVADPGSQRLAREARRTGRQ